MGHDQNMILTCLIGHEGGGAAQGGVYGGGPIDQPPLLSPLGGDVLTGLRGLELRSVFALHFQYCLCLYINNAFYVHILFNFTMNCYGKVIKYIYFKILICVRVCAFYWIGVFLECENNFPF